MINIKGGYKIIDLNNADITSTGVVVKGIFNEIESNYGKAILFENITIDNTERCGMFISFSVINSDYISDNIIHTATNDIRLSISTDDTVKYIISE